MLDFLEVDGGWGFETSLNVAGMFTTSREVSFLALELIIIERSRRLPTAHCSDVMAWTSSRLGDVEMLADQPGAGFSAGQFRK